MQVIYCQGYAALKISSNTAGDSKQQWITSRGQKCFQTNGTSNMGNNALDQTQRTRKHSLELFLEQNNAIGHFLQNMMERNGGHLKNTRHIVWTR